MKADDIAPPLTDLTEAIRRDAEAFMAFGASSGVGSWALAQEDAKTFAYRCEVRRAAHAYAAQRHGLKGYPEHDNHVNAYGRRLAELEIAEHPEPIEGLVAIVFNGKRKRS